MEINYFNFKNYKDKILLTNEQGYYYFISPQNFEHLVQGKYDRIDQKTINELKERFFLYDENEVVFIEKVVDSYRDNKSYLFSATCLHIFVLTNVCNMCCVYCQAQDSGNIHKGIMSEEIARKAVDIALQSPEQHLTFEFQGGEPLINFDMIRYIVQYTEANCNDKDIHYTVVTNTLLLTEDMLDFFIRYNFAVSTSLDGNEDVHNDNRPHKVCQGTYDVVCNNIKKMQRVGLSVGAIQTTTRRSLGEVRGIVEAYKNLDLHYLFIRPLTPLGYAKEHWGEIGYSPEEYITFYKEVLKEIIMCNQAGYQMAEGHAVIFLRKILNHYSDNYMELRSPCGAGIGQIAYYYDGQVYTCDEGRMLSEMGMPDFCLGNVNDTSYDNLMESKVCKITCQASVLESLPGCCDCVYHPYCGVCPVVNYAMEQNIYSREANNYKCKIYKGMLDTIFDYLYDNKEVMEIFKLWLD